MLSEKTHNYLQTKPEQRDAVSIRAMKERMEWNSNVFRQGDYDGKGQYTHNHQIAIIPS